MFKRFLSLFAACAIVFTAAHTEPAAQAAATATAAPPTVYCDGKAVQFESWLIGGITYIKLIDLGTALKDTGSKFAVNILSDGLDLIPGANYNNTVTGLNKAAFGAADASENTRVIRINGTPVSVRSWFIAGSSYYLLTDLAPYFNLTVARDPTRKTEAEPNGPIVMTSKKIEPLTVTATFAQRADGYADFKATTNRASSSVTLRAKSANEDSTSAMTGSGTSWSKSLKLTGTAAFAITITATEASTGMTAQYTLTYQPPAPDKVVITASITERTDGYTYFNAVTNRDCVSVKMLVTSPDGVDRSYDLTGNGKSWSRELKLTADGAYVIYFTANAADGGTGTKLELYTVKSLTVTATVSQRSDGYIDISATTSRECSSVTVQLAASGISSQNYSLTGNNAKTTWTGNLYPNNYYNNYFYTITYTLTVTATASGGATATFVKTFDYLPYNNGNGNASSIYSPTPVVIPNTNIYKYCPSCNGHRATVCPSCLGYGRLPNGNLCAVCNGAAFFLCYNCNGFGYVVK